MTRCIRTFGLALALAFSAACSANSSDQTTAENSTNTDEESAGTFRAAYGCPGFSCLMHAVAEREGAADKAGVQIEWVELPPGEWSQALAQGRVDGAAIAPTQIALLNEGGQGDFATFAEGWYQHSCWVVRSDSKYQTWTDLEGKPVASLPVTSSQVTSMQANAQLLGRNFLDMFPKLVETNAQGASVALERGDVEGIMIYEPITSLLIASGDYRRLECNAFLWEELTGAPMSAGGWTASREWLDANPQTATKIGDVLTLANKVVKENPEILRDYAEEVGITADAIDEAMKNVPPLFFDRYPDGMLASTEKLLQVAVDVGMIDKLPENSVYWEGLELS